MFDQYDQYIRSVPVLLLLITRPLVSLRMMAMLNLMSLTDRNQQDHCLPRDSHLLMSMSNCLVNPTHR